MKFLLFFILVPYCAFAFGFFDRESETRIYVNNRSNTQMVFELNAMEYSPTVNFASTQKEILKKKQITPGVLIGLNREMRLKNNFSWTVGAGGFFNKSWNEDVQKASANLPEVVQNYKRQTELFGAQASIQVNYQFDFSTTTIQPFLALAAGRGRANTDIIYSYDLGPTSIQESYDGQVEEDFDFLKYGLGLNIIGKKGIFSYLSVYQNKFTVKSKSENAKYKENGSPVSSKNTKQKINELVENMSVSLGVGYRF